jgi:hypothetical protein
MQHLGGEAGNADCEAPDLDHGARNLARKPEHLARERKNLASAAGRLGRAPENLARMMENPGCETENPAFCSPHQNSLVPKLQLLSFQSSSFGTHLSSKLCFDNLRPTVRGSHREAGASRTSALPSWSLGASGEAK